MAPLWRSIRSWVVAFVVLLGLAAGTTPARAQGSADKVSASECCLELLYAVGARSPNRVMRRPPTI